MMIELLINLGNLFLGAIPAAAAAMHFGSAVNALMTNR
jgi:hypothetical protein